MMRLLTAIAALMMIATPALAQNADATRKTIETALHETAEAWNARQMASVMTLYSDDPGTTFTTQGEVARGKRRIEMRYPRIYSWDFPGHPPTAPTDLSFKVLDFRMRGADHALVIAVWKMVLRDGTTVRTGHASLIFHKEADGWKVIADHTD